MVLVNGKEQLRHRKKKSNRFGKHEKEILTKLKQVFL